MPDEHSNLNLPAAARRPAGRHRGRRGGRGRSPRAVAGKASAAAEEIPPVSETVEESAVHVEAAEPDADTSGDFREPHSEEPAESAPPEEIAHAHSESPVEPAAEIARAPEPQRDYRPERPARPEQRRPEPARPRPWVKPADFRPAETSAISQAVAHATEIADSLKHTIDQLEEILELVEVAERQKLADEREIDELRRALRRIQPPRHQLPARGPRHDEPQRGYKEQSPRRDEPRHPRHDDHENVQRHEEPPSRPPESEEPSASVD